MYCNADCSVIFCVALMIFKNVRIDHFAKF